MAVGGGRTEMYAFANLRDQVTALALGRSRIDMQR